MYVKLKRRKNINEYDMYGDHKNLLKMFNNIFNGI